MNKKRFMDTLLPLPNSKKIVLLTGARQTGKTTLSKEKYPDLPYINLDAVENREKLKMIPAARWSLDIGVSVIDEAQKEPSIFEKIKFAYDAGNLPFTVLLGSSQITLLKQIRESLAGRISIYELFPLTIAELLTSPEQILQKPLLDHLLGAQSVTDILKEIPSILFNQEEMQRKSAETHLLEWGGMPALLNIPKEERRKWLRDYEFTYLERDLTDLARLSDLQPFRLFQKLAALRSSQLLNYSELARDAGLSVDTARRYLEYLKLSYQVELLQPYYRNLTSAMVKTPKLIWLDIGIWRQLTGYLGELTGQLYETMVIGEIIKYIKTIQQQTEIYFYRTRSGMELDLILQTPQGIIGAEIKARKTVTTKDISALKEISKKLNHEWIGGLVIYHGERIFKIDDPHIWAIPSWRLLS
jgi:uncharacterized protein